MPTVHDIKLSHFSDRIGDRFEVVVQDLRLPMTLEAAQELPGSPRPSGGFRLEFLGPPDPVLTQGIFPFEIGADRFEIFVVPIAHSVSGARYEAIFY